MHPPQEAALTYLPLGRFRRATGPENPIGRSWPALVSWRAQKSPDPKTGAVPIECLRRIYARRWMVVRGESASWRVMTTGSRGKLTQHSGFEYYSRTEGGGVEPLIADLPSPVEWQSVFLCRKTQTNNAEQSSVQCSDGNSGSSHAA
jgi:hypothetical protein